MRSEVGQMIFPAVTLGDGTGGTVTSQAYIVERRGRRGMSIVWKWLSTVVAGLTLEISNNYDARRPADARWVQVSDASILAYLTTDYVSPTSGGGKPAGTAGSGYLQIDPLQALAYRFTATRTGSSGALNVDVYQE